MRGQTIITLTEEQTEEKHQALIELLNSPVLLENIRNKVVEMVAEMFDIDESVVEVDFKALD